MGTLLCVALIVQRMPASLLLRLQTKKAVRKNDKSSIIKILQVYAPCRTVRNGFTNGVPSCGVWNAK